MYVVMSARVLGQIVVAALALAWVLYSGQIKIKESKARFADRGLEPSGSWWKEASAMAMQEDPRVSRRLFRGLRLVVVGLAMDLMGLAASGGRPATLLVAIGLVLITAGLVTLFAFSRLLQDNVRSHRSTTSQGCP